MQQGNCSITKTNAFPPLHRKSNNKQTTPQCRKEHKTPNFGCPHFLMMNNHSIICHHLPPIQNQGFKFPSIHAHPQKLFDTVSGHTTLVKTSVGWFFDFVDNCQFQYLRNQIKETSVWYLKKITIKRTANFSYCRNLEESLGGLIHTLAKIREP